MIDFFDPKKNPFVSMMNLRGHDGAQEDQSAWTPQMHGMPQGMEAMQMMTQMFQMQMQLAQMMWMIPMHLMQGMSQMCAAAQKESATAQKESAATQKEGAQQPGGFQLGGMTIPPELLQKLLHMDMSPENLEKLQKILDILFAAIPENKDK